MPLDPSTRFTSNPDEITFTVIDGEAILINLNTGAYYSMVDTAVEVWELIQAGHSVSELTDLVSRRYGADVERVRADLESFITELSEQGIVVRGQLAAAQQLPVDDSAAEGPYAPPRLNVYSDMADLLALDPPSPGLLDNLMRKPDES